MQVTIGDKTYTLKFGISFIKELDEIYKVVNEGIEFGTGVNMIYLKIQGSNPYPLYQALHAALNTQIDLTEDQFDNLIDSFESDKAYAAFFKQLQKQLEVQRQTGTLISAFKKTMKKMEENQKD